MIGEAPELLALAGSLYDAAIYPPLWVPALRRIAQSLNVWGMTLVLLDGEGREVLLRAAYNEPPSAPDALLSEQAAPPRLRTMQHTIQRRWLEGVGEAPCRLVPHFWLLPSEGAAGRADGVPATRPAEAQVLARWSNFEPHLRRALRIRRRLSGLERRSLLADTVDALSCGLFLLDAGQERHRNPPAEAHLARGNGLLVRSGGVLTAQERPGGAIRSACRSIARPAAAESIALARPRTPLLRILHAVSLSLKRGPGLIVARRPPCSSATPTSAPPCRAL